uniref:ANK_REP_REGION domain-containing protein n=1 Tax=Ascaris lumbricoides TaxID=6252 RepID=A0A0M3HEY3_ASCLU
MHFSDRDETASFSVVAEEPERSSRALGWFSIFSGASRKPSRDERPRSALPFVLSVSRRPSDASSRKSSNDTRGDFMDLVRRASGAGSNADSDRSFKLPDNALVGLSAEEKDHIARFRNHHYFFRKVFQVMNAASRRALSSHSTPSGSRRQSISYRLPEVEDLRSFEREHIQAVIEKAEKRAAPFVIKVANAIDTIKEASVDSVDSNTIDGTRKQIGKESFENVQSSSEDKTKPPLRKIGAIFESRGSITEDSLYSQQPQSPVHLSSTKDVSSEESEKQVEMRISEDNEIQHDIQEEIRMVHGENEQSELLTASEPLELTPEELAHIQKMAEIAASMDAELSWSQRMTGQTMQSVAEKKAVEEKRTLETEKTTISAVGEQKMKGIMDLSEGRLQTLPKSPQAPLLEDDEEGILRKPKEQGSEIAESGKLIITVEPELTVEKLEHIRKMAQIAAAMDAELTLPMMTATKGEKAGRKGECGMSTDIQTNSQNVPVSATKVERNEKMTDIAGGTGAGLALSRNVIIGQRTGREECTESELETVSPVMEKTETQLPSSQRLEGTAVDEPIEDQERKLAALLTAEEADHIRRMAELAPDMEIKPAVPSEASVRSSEKEETCSRLKDRIIKAMEPLEEGNISEDAKAIKQEKIIEQVVPDVQQQQPEITVEEMAHVAYINSLAEAESIYGQKSATAFENLELSEEKPVRPAEQLENIPTVQQPTETKGNLVPSSVSDAVHDDWKEASRNGGLSEQLTAASIPAEVNDDKVSSTEAINAKVSNLPRLSFDKLKGAMNAVAKAAMETLPIADDTDEEAVSYMAIEAVESIGSDEETAPEEPSPFSRNKDIYSARHQELLEAGLTESEIDQIMAVEFKAARESSNFQIKDHFSVINSDEVPVQEIGTEQGITEEEMEHIRRVQAMAEELESPRNETTSKLSSMLNPISFVGKNLGTPQLNLDDLKSTVSKPLAGIKQLSEVMQTVETQERQKKSTEETRYNIVSTSLASNELTEEEMEHIRHIEELAEADSTPPPTIVATSSLQRLSRSSIFGRFGFGSIKDAAGGVRSGESMAEMPFYAEEKIKRDESDGPKQLHESAEDEEAYNVRSQENTSPSLSSASISERTESASEGSSEYEERAQEQWDKAERLPEPAELDDRISKIASPKEAVQIAAAEGQLAAEELEHIRRIQEMADAIDAQTIRQPKLPTFGFDAVQQLSNRTSSLAGFGFGKMKNVLKEAVSQATETVPSTHRKDDSTRRLVETPAATGSRGIEGTLTEEEIRHIQEVAKSAEMEERNSKVTRNIQMNVERNISAEGNQKPIMASETLPYKEYSASFPATEVSDVAHERSFEDEAKIRLSESAVHDDQLTKEELDHIMKVAEMAKADEEAFSGKKTEYDKVRESEQQLTNSPEELQLKSFNEQLTQDLEHTRRITELAEREISYNVGAEVNGNGAEGNELLSSASQHNVPYEKADETLMEDELDHIGKVTEMADDTGLVGPSWNAVTIAQQIKLPSEEKETTRDSEILVQAENTENTASMIGSSSDQSLAPNAMSKLGDVSNLYSYDTKERSENTSSVDEWPIGNDSQGNFVDVQTVADRSRQKDTHDLKIEIAAAERDRLQDTLKQAEGSEKSNAFDELERIYTSSPRYELSSHAGTISTADELYKPEVDGAKIEATDKFHSKDHVCLENVQRTMSWDEESSLIDVEAMQHRPLISRSESLGNVESDIARRRLVRHASTRRNEFCIKSVNELSHAANVNDWYEEQLSSLRNSICDDESFNEIDVDKDNELADGEERTQSSEEKSAPITKEVILSETL